MSWIQAVLAIPVAFIVAALIHDFFAGLGEERLWSDPALDDPESFRNRAAAAEARMASGAPATSIEFSPPRSSTEPRDRRSASADVLIPSAAKS